MSIKHTIKSVLLGLKTNKSRSFLTIFGIVIGITSVILVMSIGQAAETLIISEIEALGGNFVTINPGKQPDGPQGMAGTLLSDSLGARELRALKKESNVPNLKDITPAVVVSGNVSYQGESYKPTIYGWSADWIGKIYDIYPEKGNYFTESDIEAYKPVVVIGHKVKEELFGMSEALSKKVKIKNKYFRVVGVLPDKGKVSSFMDISKFAVVPYSTAQKYLLGQSHYQEINILAKNEQVVPGMVKDIERTLRNLHDIEDPDNDDFYVTTSADMIERIGLITTVLKVLLTSIAAVSLLVGGIGIMNIMLVSVTEKTREIGLRKALGAKKKDILLHFLFESVILTLIGGFFGVLFGIGLSYLASLILKAQFISSWQFGISLPAIFLGIGVAGFVGLVFGIYPAKKASLKSPIEALRYE